MWGEARPVTITFFLDNTAMVADQYGRPIRGTIVNNKEVFFAMEAPQSDDTPTTRAKLATHAQTIAALTAERVDWTKLTWAGWPQISYDELKALPTVPSWSFSSEHRAASNSVGPCGCVVCSIRDPKIRRDAMRFKQEMDNLLTKQMDEINAELQMQESA
jgi:hypothetical protein